MFTTLHLFLIWRIFKRLSNMLCIEGLQYFAKRNETKRNGTLRNGTLRNGTLRNGYKTMLHHTLSRVPRIPLKAEDL